MMMGVKRLVVLLFSLLFSLCGLACGPSFQAIYEGNARFEHCYALEENAQTAMREKSDCWRDWSEHYTYGQTRDRIHYATARFVALSQSTNLPTDEAMMMGAPGVTPRQTTITAPQPTNAFAPPPKVLDDGDAGAKPQRPSELPLVVHFAAPASSPPPGVSPPPASSASQGSAPPAAPAIAPLPGAECTDGCGKKVRECKELAQACDKSYRACMRACFK